MSKSSDWDIDRRNNERESTSTIYTLGYSGWKAEDVAAAAKKLDAVVADVRMVPRSRFQPVWNSAALSARLGQRYAWLKELGNRNYKGTFEQIEIADFPAGEERLRELTAGGKSVILLCACKDVNVCHRKVLAERLAAMWGVEVVHLAHTAEPGAAPKIVSARPVRKPHPRLF